MLQCIGGKKGKTSQWHNALFCAEFLWGLSIIWKIYYSSQHLKWFKTVLKSKCDLALGQLWLAFFVPLQMLTTVVLFCRVSGHNTGHWQSVCYRVLIVPSVNVVMRIKRKNGIIFNISLKIRLLKDSCKQTLCKTKLKSTKKCTKKCRTSNPNGFI